MVNFSTSSLALINVLLVLMCWTNGSSGTAFSLEEEFIQMKIQVQELVKNLQEKNAEIQEKVAELEAKNVQMRQKVKELQAKVQEQDFILNLHIKTNLDSNPISISQSAVAINGMPSSCDDLKVIGHTLNGFYSVMGSAMMESVYCDFTKQPSDAGFEKWIGFADVKSTPVYFYVQRSSPFIPSLTLIPFDLARVNEGNAMNLTTGIFTAPRTGVYFFSFSGMTQYKSSPSAYYFLYVDLFLNGASIGSGRVESEAHPTYTQYSSPVTIQATLNLKPGDVLWLRKTGNSELHDSYIDHFTHFTGFMLKEEIVASV